VLGLLGAVVGAVVITIVFAPPIALLFRRSRHALTWILALLAIFAFLLIASLTLPAESPLTSQLRIAGVVGSLLFGYFAYYLFSLRRQELLR
jgi:Ca2+/Na+ antiporter